MLAISIGHQLRSAMLTNPYQKCGTSTRLLIFGEESSYLLYYASANLTQA